LAVTRRLARKIHDYFPADAGTVIWMLQEAEREVLGYPADADHSERILGAVVLKSEGDVERLFEHWSSWRRTGGTC
jgi:hypothetical protein